MTIQHLQHHLLSLDLDFNDQMLQQERFETHMVNRRGEIIKSETHAAYCFRQPITMGIDLEMVAIPGGTYLMGSLIKEEGNTDDERPQHEVKVTPFFMGKYPITQSQWRYIANQTELKVQIDLDPDPSDTEGVNRPVESVTWHEAIEFCARLSNLTGMHYRLPSESEWEHACRAGTTTPFHFGETITTNLANYNAVSTYADEPKGEMSIGTTPVGQFSPNAFGLYDLHGQVWEWCLDDWHDNYEGSPTDNSAWIDDNEDDSVDAVLRGGSWDEFNEDCRSASRYYHPKTRQPMIYGLRVVLIPVKVLVKGTPKYLHEYQ